MKPPILITGCARSGTSLTAGIINICGAFGGDTFGPNEFNRKGMFENKRIRQEIVKPYLKSLGVDPMGQKPLPNRHQIFEINPIQADNWRKRIIQVMVSEGYKEGDWYYKGAKLCLVWYLWAQAFPDATWVIVRRDEESIVRSCLRTRFMSKYRDAIGWRKWVKHHEQRFEEIKDNIPMNRVIEFWPSKVIDGDLEYAKNLVDKLGLEWKEQLVNTFVDPSLYHFKKKEV